MITYLINIFIYKYIFKEKIIESIISTSLLMIILFLSDVINSLIYVPFFQISDIRGIWYLRLIGNITLSLICVGFLEIKQFRNLIQKIYKKLSTRRYRTSILFVVLIISVFTIIEYNFAIKFKLGSEFFINIFLVIIFTFLMSLFIREKDNNDRLASEYDNLFNYIQNFEDWIEKEQLNRHEYKNQLAVLRDITKEKTTRAKIDEILEDNINLEGEVLNQLKTLPKGGIKGLMYYKLVIAQKNKIDLTVDVSIKRKSILNKLSEKQIRDLCKLIGIYFDNAIEAASETRKKRVLVEVYELKDKVNIVFSNTFKKNNNFDNRNKKGVSSKGDGHGNGLYFAKKLISKNEWLKEKQEIIDGYYIEQLSILKLEK
ncbi:MAG: GHKL domain-containing protein [Bacilli bacterium]|nr:GHKL domain-containing protein [Bacilli bacterium]